MSYLFRKAASSLKNKGILETAKTGFRFIKYSILSNNKKRIILDNIVNTESYGSIVVFENNFGWTKIMKQRPQQIAENLPDDVLMFYHTHFDGDFDNKKRVTKLKDNLILVDLGYYRESLMEKIKECPNKYLMIYSTDFIEMERVELYVEEGYDVIYEYVDDINRDLMGDDMYRLLSERHRELMKLKNISIVCTANELKNKLSRESVLITNGVDYNKFKAAEYPVPSDLAPIKSRHEVLICYYGALASWFDYELIKKLAKSNRKYGIVLIGIEYDGTLKKSGVLDEENVYYLGRKQYEELPSYGCNVDVLTIPFIINDITKATSPVKIFEYMAMEKPIVTTDLPECRKYASVLISKTHDEFIENVARAASLENDGEYIATERREAMENDWSSKAADMIEFARGQRYIRLEKEIAEVMSRGDVERIVVWRSPFGWDVPLFQRPQHIARQLARRGSLVFYETTLKTDSVSEMKEEEKNLLLVNFEDPKVCDAVMRAIEESKLPKYIQFYSTNWSMSLDEMKGYIDSGYRILYEYIDDISPDLAGTEEIPEYILDKYNYVMEHPEIPVVTTARRLYDDVKEKRGEENLAFACNGVDYEFFTDFSVKHKFIERVKRVLSNGKLNVCYYGALASWFDYDLIKKLNATGKYNIILIGIPYDDSFHDSGIEKLSNVHFFGPIPYKDLKYYAVKMDVLTIPFVINSITQATSPLKLFEYMALHKPIVTTAMDECKNYKSVLIANDHDEFIERLETARRLKDDREYLALLDKEARDNDWSMKADAIIELIKRGE